MDKERLYLPDDFYNQASDVLGPDFWQEIGELIPVTGPRIDLYYTDSAVTVLAELPGLQTPERIGIRLEGQTLVLEGEIPRPYPVTDNRIIRKERFFGRFVRALPLPRPVAKEGIQAKYRQGLLVVELRVDPAVQQPNIPIEY